MWLHLVDSGVRALFSRALSYYPCVASGLYVCSDASTLLWLLALFRFPFVSRALCSITTLRVSARADIVDGVVVLSLCFDLS